MNERIFELKRQAMLFAQEKCDGQTTDMHGNLRSNIWTEKFAEMIVGECLKEIKDMIVEESELLYPNNKQTTLCVNDRLRDAYDNIAEHFGVDQ